MTALSFVWVHPYSQNSGCDIYIKFHTINVYSVVHFAMVVQAVLIARHIITKSAVTSTDMMFLVNMIFHC